MLLSNRPPAPRREDAVFSTLREPGTGRLSPPVPTVGLGRSAFLSTPLRLKTGRRRASISRFPEKFHALDAR